MSGLQPSDQNVLATAVCDSLVVAMDPESRRSCIFFWENSRDLLLAVVDAVKEHDDPEIHVAGTGLLESPPTPGAIARSRKRSPRLTAIIPLRRNSSRRPGPPSATTASATISEPFTGTARTIFPWPTCAP